MPNRLITHADSTYGSKLQQHLLEFLLFCQLLSGCGLHLDQHAAFYNKVSIDTRDVTHLASRRSCARNFIIDNHQMTHYPIRKSEKGPDICNS